MCVQQTMSFKDKVLKQGSKRSRLWAPVGPKFNYFIIMLRHDSLFLTVLMLVLKVQGQRRKK